MSQVVPVLRDVRERLADPRRWLKGHWCGYIDSAGRRLPCVPENVLANCWCLGGAITVSIASAITRPGKATFTELRSDAERELLDTLREQDVHVNAVYLWNDDAKTSHADVLGLLDSTLDRLEAA